MKRFLILVIFAFAASSFAQQIEYVDFKHADVDLKIFPEQKSVAGSVLYTFDVLKPTDSICVDAQTMEIEEVLLNKKKVAFDYNNKRIKVSEKIKKSEKNELKIQYKAQPKNAMYFVGWEDAAPNQVWTQGQGKYTSNWLPSFDDTNEKVEFDLTFLTDSGYELMANGKLVDKLDKGPETEWHFDMQHPMSSYLLAVVVGKYDKQIEYSQRNIPLEMYYYPEDSLKVEPTYRYTKKIFDFLENEIGFEYPWDIYRQVPVYDFLYGGMENTSCTIYADTYVVDSTGFNDRNYVNVNAHELAHQWFGDLVTAKSGEHHWLQEGFATYYALLAEREVFGDKYYYWRLYEYAQQLKDQDRSGTGGPLMDAKASSLTFYRHGCWALHALREKVGDKAFKMAVSNYLKKFQYRNVETSDFISEVEKASGTNLADFVNLWLKNKTFPYEEANELLMKSKFIQEYEMVDCEANNSKCTYYLESYISNEAKIKIIQQKPDLITPETFKNPLKVRQAIAQVLTTVPLKLKKEYESLLEDHSYITKETALYNLWNSFPDNRSEYLDELEEVNGLNYNVKLLWLALAINTEGYKQEEKEQLYTELVNFTGPDYNFDVRINAFQYLLMMGACDEACIANLEQAKTHHNWRMVKFAKEQLEKMNKFQKN